MNANKIATQLIKRLNVGRFIKSWAESATPDCKRMGVLREGARRVIAKRDIREGEAVSVEDIKEIPEA